MAKKTKPDSSKVEGTEKPEAPITKDIKGEPAKATVPIVITETEADVVLDSGFNGDPDNLKNAIKKEAAKSDVLSRFLIPLFTFILIGVVATGLTWYYARPEVANQKQNEEKIETPPVVTETAKPAATTPVATPAPAATAPAAAQPTTYVVKEGDTMSTIANANGITSATLATYNGISDPNSLKIGQTLKIPPK
jgi:LysM repeat protein